MVCNVCYCTGFPVVTESKPVVPSGDILDTLYRELWIELHTKVEAAEQFELWVKRVPQFGCGCARWLNDYIAVNTPTGDLREYGWTLHNAVNKKLRDEGKDRPEFSWDEFEQKYPPGRND